MKWSNLIILTLSVAVTQSKILEELEIKISKDIPALNCENILNNLEDLLTSSSRQFYSVTGYPINKVTIHLPPSWQHSPCSSSALSAPSLASALDVVVEDTPYSLSRGGQFGGCGTRGLSLSLPLSSINQNITKNTDQTFFTQLLSNSFGLFSNSGSKSSKRYPAQYSVGNQLFDNLGCFSGDNICSDLDYNPDAPTKQNLLCSGQSWLQIIRQTYPELNQTLPEQDSENQTDLVPEFVYSLTLEPVLVLLLDRSAQMEDLNRWKNVHNALHRIISDIPSGTRIGIITYDAEEKINLEPTEITEFNRAGIHGKIPGRVGKSGKPCLACGLKSAGEMVKNGGKVILVSSGEGHKDVSPQLVKNLSLYLIGYSDMEQNLISSSAEDVFILRENDNVDDVADIFYQILKTEELIESRFRFYTRKFRVQSNERIGGKFVVEESLRSGLHVVAGTEMKEDVEMFELISPSGKQFQFPVVEHGILHFQFPGLSEPGVWGYNFKTVSSASRQSFQVSISATAEKNEAETGSLQVWLSNETPTIIYARVRYGSLPVSNASVTASIILPGEGNLELVLQDMGGGYPDITPGDGIYSAYFTQISSKPGFYTTNLQASDGAGGAQILNLDNSETPTPSFTRYARATFYLAEGAEYFIRDGIPQMNDKFPPARITDLKVENYLSDSLQVQLAWTAPGGDLNTGGAVSRYDIRCYTNRAALNEENFSVIGIPVPDILVPVPGSPGSIQEVNITLPWHNEIFYYGIVAVDDSNNRGLVSNLVPVFIDEVPTVPENPEESSLKSAPIFQHKDDNIIYIVSGSLTGLALIALCFGIAFICRTKKKDVLDKSDSLDYIKELGPSTLLPASRYSFTYPDKAFDHPESGYISQHYPSQAGTYSTTVGTYSSESETYSPEAGAYSPKTGTYSPPRTSPSEYSTDSVFMTSKPQSSLYVTYQNLPTRVESSGSEQSELNSELQRREWELMRQSCESEIISQTWSGKHSTYSGTWSPQDRGDQEERSKGLDIQSYSGSSGNQDFKDKRRRRESFV